MGVLTETEIFDQMLTGFSEAASLCDHMAKTPLRGKAYKRLIEITKLIEGCCRQAGHWRENHEWFLLGGEVRTLRLKYGNWIREQHRGDAAKRLFAQAAAAMRRLQNLAQRKKDARHSRLGQILPSPGEGPARQRAVQVPRKTPGGLYLPAGVTLQ